MSPPIEDEAVTRERARIRAAVEAKQREYSDNETRYRTVENDPETALRFAVMVSALGHVLALLAPTDHLPPDGDKLRRAVGNLLRQPVFIGDEGFEPTLVAVSAGHLAALRAALPPDGEKPFDEADDMCPNCVTPWKCNGPHLPPDDEKA